MKQFERIYSNNKNKNNHFLSLSALPLATERTQEFLDIIIPNSFKFFSEE